ncbi:unnamed protein product [Didymodactylos carnosus]|nr:unnamed protein product [Didymodactylos carnosus]CAF4269489.1 unnamed protein product [Didymodactylos carnosus]
MENQPTKKVYQFNGLRPCRGSQIECVIVTTSLDNFPEIPATEETWDAMNVEWAWSQRNHSASINCPNPPCSETLFDYPVHLYLKLYRRTHNEGLGFETEDVLYDFYELNDDIHQNEFDVSLCYRSNDLDYLRLAFNLKMNSNENFHLHRHALILGLHREAARVMNIQPLRISNLEVDYDQQDDTVYALFTLLDKTPLLNSPEELNVQEARTKLETAINANNFTFDLFFLFTDTNKITVKAVPNSMADSKQYISLHSRLNRKKTVKYTKGSQTGAVIGGILVGLIVGIILIVAIKYVRKDPLPSSEQLKGTFFTSPFHSRKNQANTQSESNT